jgi:drug/metabolite transporter (DMT)-like permease
MRVHPIFVLAFATLLFGASNVVQKMVFVSLDAWTSLGCRGLLACLALLPFAGQELRRTRIAFSEVLQAALPVSIWFTLGMSFQVLGAEHTTATNVGFLINTCVVFTPFIVWALTGERPGLRIWLSVAACFAGLVLLTGNLPHRLGLGDMLCLASAIGYSAWIISLGRAMAHTPAPITVTCMQWLAPTVAGLYLGQQSTDAAALMSQAPMLIFLGVVVGGVGFMLAAKAQASLAVCTAAMVYSLEAVFGALLARVFLAEDLSSTGWIGAALTLTSIVFVQCNPLEKLWGTKPTLVRIEPRLF